MDVAGALHDLLLRHDGGDPGLDLLVAELVEELEAVAARAVALLDEAGPRDGPAGAPSLRLPKARLAALGRCERSAVALADGEDGGAVSTAVLLGVAHDRFVIHQLHAGRVREPLEDLREMLLAEGEWELLDALDQLESSDEDAARARLDPVAATVADAWSGIDEQWLPRTQSRATLLLAGGRVVCSGLVDVELGGPATGLPTVVVEVKSARPGADHVAEVGHYALLVAARDGRPPAAVARWYPGTAPAVVEVGAGVLESAARRLGDGITAWAELVSGRPPQERPGPWCGWCPAAGVCESARRADGGSNGDGVDGPTVEAGGRA